MKKIAVVPGFAEGGWHAKKIYAELEKAGYKICKDITNADIVITHSGGCYMLPDNLNADRVFMVAVPLLKNSSDALKKMKDKVKQEYKNHKEKGETRVWNKKIAYNTAYLAHKPRRWIDMGKGAKKLRFPSGKAKKILIYNSDDNFSSLNEHKKLSEENNWPLIVMPGDHDDLWDNPSRYIKAIKDNS